MPLIDLRLVNFRNFSNFPTPLSSVVVLVGANGTGKTNFLEAIYFLATSKTFRKGSDRQAIQWGRDYFQIKAHYKRDERTGSLVLYCDQLEKIYKVNSHLVRAKDILGHLPVVLFTAEQIEIINGPPAQRRKLFNTLLCQKSSSYLGNLWQYQRALFARNQLLAKIHNARGQIEELIFWEKALIKFGAPLIEEREKMTHFFAPLLKTAWSKLNSHSLTFDYRPSSTKEHLADNLKLRRPYDIEVSQTSVGPHRDEFALQEDGRPLGIYGSRGERRSALLALKLAENEFLKDQAPPFLLLDDIFSELDAAHRQVIGQLVAGASQVIYTSTELAHLPTNLTKGAKIITLSK